MPLTYKGKTAADIYHGSTPILQAYRGGDIIFAKGDIGFPDWGYDKGDLNDGVTWYNLKNGTFYWLLHGVVNILPYTDWISRGQRKNGEVYVFKYNMNFAPEGFIKVKSDVPFKVKNFDMAISESGDLYHITSDTTSGGYIAELLDPAGTNPVKSVSTSRWDRFIGDIAFNEQGQGFIPYGISQRAELLYDGAPAEWMPETSGRGDVFIRDGRLCYLYYNSPEGKYELRSIADDPGGWQCVTGYPEGLNSGSGCIGIRDGELYRITDASCTQKFSDWWEEERIYNNPGLPQWDFPAEWRAVTGGQAKQSQSFFDISYYAMGVCGNRLIAFCRYGMDTLGGLQGEYVRDISCGMKWNTMLPGYFGRAVTRSGKLYMCNDNGVTDAFTGRTIDA